MHTIASQDMERARRAMGATQVELAALLGVAVRTLIRWEQGASPVPTDVTPKMARMLRQHGEACERLALEFDQMPLPSLGWD